MAYSKSSNFTALLLEVAVVILVAVKIHVHLLRAGFQYIGSAYYIVVGPSLFDHVYCWVGVSITSL